MADETLLQYLRLLESNTEEIKQTLVRMEERLGSKVSEAEHSALEARVASAEKTVHFHSLVGKSVGTALSLVWAGLLAIFTSK